ncbi:MAG: tetratricopeptide repeat protein [Bacteroidales bacterium]|nr:tetratricopeptide repeat protein [Bacteroidales bacterium]
MKRFVMTFAALLLCFAAAFAQNERREVRRGNRQFGKEKYQECEISYKKALVADSLSAAANYNLGNTYYRMENYAEADKAFAAVQDSLIRKPADISKRYHNMGNSFLKQRNWKEAIEAYKNALRRNPGDMETKANLAYAQKMLENEQQNQDNQDQNQDGDQNKDQDQNNDQNQDQNKDQNQDQNKDQNQNPDQNRDGQQPQPQPKISQQDAQQILQAIQDKEKETQDKVKKEKALLLKSKQKEKNW